MVFLQRVMLILGGQKQYCQSGICLALISRRNLIKVETHPQPPLKRKSKAGFSKQ